MLPAEEHECPVPDRDPEPPLQFQHELRGVETLADEQLAHSSSSRSVAQTSSVQGSLSVPWSGLGLLHHIGRIEASSNPCVDVQRDKIGECPAMTREQLADGAVVASGSARAAGMSRRSRVAVLRA